MANQVPWNATITEEFIKDGLLTEFEETVLREHIAGISRVATSIHTNTSLSTVDRCIARLKAKYDVCAMYNPLLPKRSKRNVYR